MQSKVKSNIIYNILGVILPTLVGIYAVRVLLINLGADRMGIFTLALSIAGFSGIFDLGLGRSLTQTVASAVGQGCSPGTVVRLVHRTFPIVFLMGMVWGTILWAAAGLLAQDVFHLQGQLSVEAMQGLRWLAISIPALLLSTSLIGVLEGLQKFAIINLFKVPLGVMTFLVPAFASLVWQNVGLVIGVLVVTRIGAVVIWLCILMRTIPLFRPDTTAPLNLGALWRFTGWLSVSNVVGPFMVQADRYYLASLFPPAVVAYYTVPLDTLFRATALPLAAMNVVFPALAHSGSDSAGAGGILRGASYFMLFFWGMPIAFFSLVLGWLLALWLGEEFSMHALPIAQWILLGVLINGFAHIPFALLQSAGRADLTAKLHVIELPIYIFLIVVLVAAFGIAGAAVAWTVRIALDTAMLFGLARAYFPALRKQLLLAPVMAVLLSLTVLSINALTNG